jgi:uncharacterized protein (DUF983 family)
VVVIVVVAVVVAVVAAAAAAAARTWGSSLWRLLVIPVPDVQTVHLGGQCPLLRRVSGIDSIRCHNGHEVKP